MHDDRLMIISLTIFLVRYSQQAAPEGRQHLVEVNLKAKDTCNCWK